MSFKNKEHNIEPHSPDVNAREILDNGFSKGFGFHFLPNEMYWVDCHNHLVNGSTHSEIYKLMDQWFSKLDAFRLEKILLIASDCKAFSVYSDISRQDKRFGWLISLPFDKPDVQVFKSAIENGAVGLKLHNAPIIRGLGTPDVWLSDAWCKIFELVEKNNIPVLWHITQRLSMSPYHGGGENAYWSDGYKRGINFTNEDLLQVSLKVLKDFPRLKLLGAHQLHVGLERLSKLFDEYANLYIDTSCGFFLRWADTFYDCDKELYRNFFVKYQDRILFGTDSNIGLGNIDEYSFQGYLGHARFVNQLCLPDQVLQKTAHGNAERIFALEPMEIVRRGNIRP